MLCVVHEKGYAVILGDNSVFCSAQQYVLTAASYPQHALIMAVVSPDEVAASTMRLCMLNVHLSNIDGFEWREC